MGNTICKKKDHESVQNTKSRSKFNRFFKSLYLVPNSWKSESHLNGQDNICAENPDVTKTKHQFGKNHSRSSDWTEAFLEVPSETDVIKKTKPILSFTFTSNNNTAIPKPPPRKKKKELSNQVAQKNLINSYENKVPVEEPLCIKKNINYYCPCHQQNSLKCPDDQSLTMHKEKDIKNNNEEVKRQKRQKNLSVVSLPNFTDLKMQVFDNVDCSLNENRSTKSSNVSLSLSSSKKNYMKNYMTRCRSFGSLLPNQLLGKVKPSNKNISDAESDDSFGALEDWDLGLIEHYNPRDASLPRPSKLPKTKIQKKSSSMDLKPVESQLTSANLNEISNDSDSSLINSTDSSDYSNLLKILEEYSTNSNNLKGDKILTEKKLSVLNNKKQSSIKTNNSFMLSEKNHSEKNFELATSHDRTEILV